MVILNKIYTKTGDAGSTALGSGERVAKYELRIEAFGTVDEANACIGLVRQHTVDQAFRPLDTMLGRIQNDLFDLGADLCVPDRGEPLEYEPLRITDAQVDRLEGEIDELNSELEPLRSFVLPGGTAAAASLHLARTVMRRAERRMVELAAQKSEPVSDAALRYANRLSDFLFVASRWTNTRSLAGDSPAGDVLWVPGKNR